jgi:hypothetical protein
MKGSCYQDGDALFEIIDEDVHIKRKKLLRRQEFSQPREIYIVLKFVINAIILVTLAGLSSLITMSIYDAICEKSENASRKFGDQERNIIHTIFENEPRRNIIEAFNAKELAQFERIREEKIVFCRSFIKLTIQDFDLKKNNPLFFGVDLRNPFNYRECIEMNDGDILAAKRGLDVINYRADEKGCCTTFEDGLMESSCGMFLICDSSPVKTWPFQMKFGVWND